MTWDIKIPSDSDTCPLKESDGYGGMLCISDHGFSDNCCKEKCPYVDTADPQPCEDEVNGPTDMKETIKDFGWFQRTGTNGDYAFCWLYKDSEAFLANKSTEIFDGDTEKETLAKAISWIIDNDFEDKKK